MNILSKIWKKLNGTCNQVYSISNKIDIHNYEFKFEITKLYLQNSLLNDSKPGITDEKYFDKEVIISLTSHGKRIEEVWMSIESIMQQTAKANKIILWLDEKEKLNNLPYSLKIQMKRGLEVRIYKPDIRSYKKLIPTLLEFPNDIIITIDDDIIYDFNLIEKLIRSYSENPSYIHAARTHVMTFDNDGNLKNYADWRWMNSLAEKNSHLFFTGVGGVLYPPHSLDQEVFNEEVFTKIAPTADDVWFNAMALKKGTPIKKIKTRTDTGEDHLINLSVQDIGLLNINTGENAMNDPQIHEVYTKYNLLSKL